MSKCNIPPCLFYYKDNAILVCLSLDVPHVTDTFQLFVVSVVDADIVKFKFVYNLMYAKT